MNLVIALVIGVAIGMILSRIISKTRMAGILRVDTSDPDDRPFLFLEMSRDVESIARSKYVIFRVSTKNYVSRD